MTSRFHGKTCLLTKTKIVQISKMTGERLATHRLKKYITDWCTRNREKFKSTFRLNHQHLMLGLATARLSRRYTPAILKWATCRGIRITRNTKRRKGYAQIYFATLPC